MPSRGSHTRGSFPKAAPKCAHCNERDAQGESVHGMIVFGNYCSHCLLRHQRNGLELKPPAPGPRQQIPPPVWPAKGGSR